MVKTKEIHQLTLSSNVKLFRGRKGWSQITLAEKADVSVAAISQIEACRRWPRSETLEAIAKALDVSIPVLLAPHSEKHGHPLSMGTTPVEKAMVSTITALQEEVDSLRASRETMNSKASPDKAVIIDLLDSLDADSLAIIRNIIEGRIFRRSGIRKVKDRRKA